MEGLRGAERIAATNCQINAGGFFDLGISSIGTAGGQVARVTLGATFGTIIGVATDVTLSCQRVSGSGTFRAWYGEIVATKVATLTQYAG